MIDTTEIEKQIKETIKNKIDILVKDENILQLISNTIDEIVAEKISSIVSTHFNNSIQKGKIEKELNSKYQEKLYTLLDNEIKQRAANAVARIDMTVEIGKSLSECVSNRLKTASLPDKFISHKNINWDGFQLTANALTNGIIENFTSTGIQDVASEIELTVADQVVVIENTLVVKNAEVKENFVANDICVNNITVNDKFFINENINKQFVSLIKDTFTNEISKKKIDVIEKPIYANDKEVLTENTLGSSVINSNLRKLGRLTELNVSGIAEFNDTLLVTNTGKIGINTTDPEGALTIWDDDCELTVRKYKKKNMYLGTTRDTNLSLGVNGDVKLMIQQDGTVSMKTIELNGIKISISNTIPSGLGSAGQLVLMSNASEDEPWAYRCIGGDRWKAIK